MVLHIVVEDDIRTGKRWALLNLLLHCMKTLALDDLPVNDSVLFVSRRTTIFCIFLFFAIRCFLCRIAYLTSLMKWYYWIIGIISFKYLNFRTGALRIQSLYRFHNTNQNKRHKKCKICLHTFLIAIVIIWLDYCLGWAIFYPENKKYRRKSVLCIFYCRTPV